MDGLLAAAREVLGMEFAYLSEIRDDALVLREVDGDTDAYGGVGPGFALPRRDVLVPPDGRRQRAAARHRRRRGAAGDARTRSCAATGIRAYAGVPVRREDGTLIGTLCCLSRAPQPQLGERDLRYLDVLARMAARAARGRRRRAQERRRAELEAAAGQALLAALNARENYTAEHSEAVLELALEVAARARARRPRRPPRSARWRCCTTSARSACPTRSCASRAG